MLRIEGPASRFCDGVTRRDWLRIGGLALGGLTLPDLLRAESITGKGRGIRGVIMVVLPGGPSHLDMYDLKPDAPLEIRGEFEPIATSVPGLELCELLPRLASLADHFAIIRSLVGFHNDHNTPWCTTGWESHAAMPASPLIPGFPPGGWPSMGAILSKQLGTRVAGVPTAVDLVPVDLDARFIMRTAPTQPGYLGAAHAGFEVASVDRRNIMLNGISPARLADRRALLNRFDTVRRELDQVNYADGLDEIERQAFAVLTSPRLAKALDLSREEPTVRARYGLDRAYPSEREG